jgi:hypothetical protein
MYIGHNVNTCEIYQDKLQIYCGKWNEEAEFVYTLKKLYFTKKI